MGERRWVGESVWSHGRGRGRGWGGVMQQVRKAIRGMSVFPSFEFIIYYGCFYFYFLLGYRDNGFHSLEGFSISGFIGGWGF